MTYAELEAYADALGAIITYGDIDSAALVKLPTGPPVICMPRGPVRWTPEWMLAHELGHLVLGHNVGELPVVVQEIQANHWAKQVMGGMV